MYPCSNPSARSQPPPPPVELDGELYFTFERVVGKVRPRREYLIKWKDYGAEHNSWEPERTILADSNESVREFWEYAKHPIPAPLHNIGVATARNASRVAMQTDRHKPLRMSTTTRKPRSSGLDRAQMACVALGIPGLAYVPTPAPVPLDAEGSLPLSSQHTYSPYHLPLLPRTGV
jgi:hypothetical protein